MPAYTKNIVTAIVIALTKKSKIYTSQITLYGFYQHKFKSILSIKRKFARIIPKLI
jgi:cell division FtsZ-interacting protein ZapD